MHLRCLGARAIATLIFCSVAFASSLVLGAPATRLSTPGGGQVVFSAQEASRDFDRQVVELKGHVQVIYDAQAISCDHAIIDLKRQEITAIGNLVISSPTAYIEGDQATLSYATNSGIIYNGFVKSGQVLFEGRVVKKTGPETYEAETAYFTACTTCPAAWSFAGSKFTAEMGGYAHVKNSVLEIANVPVFWLPYLIVPLKSERQTGLLIPSFDYTASGGAALGLHFFWAISRSQDAMFTLKNYSRRGIKGLVNYRYVLSDTSQGELNSGLISDKLFISDQAKAGRPVGFKKYRWFTTYSHVYELPDNFIQRAKINLVSDLRYTRDFPDEMSGLGDPALENRLSLTRNTEDTHASLDSSYYINQLKTDPLDSNQDSIHRFPELRYSLVERNVLGTKLLFNLNTDYVNFAREDFAYDDVENSPRRQINPNRGGTATSGTFSPGTDLIRAGQRFDVTPEFSYPIHVGTSSTGDLFDILPSVQAHHTQYAFNVSPALGSGFNTAPVRQYVRGQVSLRSVFSRVYSPAGEAPPPTPTSSTWVDAESAPANSRSENSLALVPPPPPPPLYKHEIQPEVVFAGVPWLKQSESSFFGESEKVPAFLVDQPISDSDFFSTRGIQFDYNDRITYRNTLSFILNNRLVKKEYSAASAPDYRQIASFRLAQSYDFDEASRSGGGSRFPWSDISALLDVRLQPFETNTLVRYFPYHNVINTSSRAKFTDVRGNYLQLNFAQTYLITPQTEEAYRGRSENVGFEAGFNARYLTFAGALAYQPKNWSKLDFFVKSWSTFLVIKPPGNCWGIRMSLSQAIGSELSYHLNFDFQFGGENT